MPIVRIREREPFEIALRRFKRSCEKAGIMSEMRRHEYYEKPTWARKREKAQAQKRWLKKLSREKMVAVRGGGERVKVRKDRFVRREREE